MTTGPGRHSFRRLLSALLVQCLVTAPWICCLPVQAVTDSGSPSGLTLAGDSLSASAAQAAELLGVRADVDDILALRRDGATPADAGNLVGKRARVLRKLFHAVLQVQAAENRLESEMSYTYDVLSREQRRINTVNQFFNMMNFMQFGVLYTIEPYSRMHKQFKQSAICTSIGAGLGIGLPVMCIFYNKLARASHLSPPNFLSHVIDGQPVDGSNMPPLVVQYLDAAETGESRSRRACLSALWKERYGVEMAKRETLCGIADGKPKSTGVLNTRIVLLWSLYTVVQGFNRDLLALLNEVRDKNMLSPETDLNGGAGEASITANLRDYTGLSAGAAEAARLLRVKPLLDELKSLQGAPESDSRVMQLRICLLESVLAGYLDVQIAADKCQEEMNYQYDVVLAQMMARRGRFLQKTFEANFIQSGTLGACAGWSYLNGYTKAGNQCFMVANSMGIAISTISFIATHGGWRKNQTPPNSLAEFFELKNGNDHAFSPMVWNYLNSPSPKRGDTKSRRQFLRELWAKNAVANIDLKDRRNLEKLGSMPSCKWDTIKLVLNRIALLESLQEQFGDFDAELLSLLRETWPIAKQGAGSNSALSLSKAELASVEPGGVKAARLLGVTHLLADIESGRAGEDSKLLITGSVLDGFLESTADANMIAHQIIVESQVMNRMIRQRDAAIQLTNIINFYQIGILGVISDSLGVCNNEQFVLVGNRINVVSGMMVGCLALVALAERRGGLRPGKALPNSIGNVFGRQTETASLSPLMNRYLSTVSPASAAGLTHRDELIKYWKEAKVLSVNVRKPTVVEKLSAESKATRWWSETIGLISNRVTMLYDLRATLRSSNLGFDDLVEALD